MSWSVSFLGKAENVAKALYDANKMDGQSKIEYEAALPHLVALVHENFGNDNYLIKLDANGHGSSINGEQKERYCSVKIEPIYTNLV